MKVPKITLTSTNIYTLLISLELEVIHTCAFMFTKDLELLKET